MTKNNNKVIYRINNARGILADLIFIGIVYIFTIIFAIMALDTIGTLSLIGLLMLPLAIVTILLYLLYTTESIGLFKKIMILLTIVNGSILISSFVAQEWFNVFLFIIMTIETARLYVEASKLETSKKETN